MNARHVLILSLGFNALLVAALALVLARRPVSSASRADAPATLKAARDSMPPTTAAPTPPTSLDWIERLRAADVPAAVIAAAAEADFDRRWWRRQRELQRQFSRGDID